MTRFTHLSKAPITEAIIQYGVVAPEGLTLEVLEGIAKSIAEMNGFTLDHPFYDMDGELLLDTTTGEAIPKFHRRTQVGFRLTSSDKNKALLVTLNGVSFHKLKPYTNWDDVFAQASGYWSTYRELVDPVSIRRLGARFINRLQLPLPDRLGDYLNGPPVVSDQFNVADYLRRVNVRHVRTSLRANMVTAVEVPSVDGPKEVIIIIDNEVYTLKSAEPADDSTIAILFKEIHSLKNELFWDALTPSVLEMYK